MFVIISAPGQHPPSFSFLRIAHSPFPLILARLFIFPCIFTLAVSSGLLAVSIVSAASFRIVSLSSFSPFLGRFFGGAFGRFVSEFLAVEAL